MEKAEDKKMIAEMNGFLADKAKAKSGDDPKAEENLPFESIDSYSTDPVGFGEMSLRMMNKVEIVFDLAVKENRFSPKYLKRCKQLEKGIKYLGSLCITKYALQTKGQTFPHLGQLSTEKLYCMTSHHFRKLDMAVTEYMFEHRDVPDKLFDMEMRYFNLLERLRSTEVKIEKFHDRYIFGPEDYSPIIHGMAFSGKNKTRSILEKHDEAPAFRHAPAFSAYGGKFSGISGQGSEMTVAPDLGCAPRRRGLTPSVTGMSEMVPQYQSSPAQSEVPVPHMMGEALSLRSRCPGELIPAAPTAGTAEVPVDKEECSADSDSSSPEHVSNDPISAFSDEKLPPCLEIMKRVMERSREEDDGSLTFTIEEMEFLAGDPLFARLDPRMAGDIRKILEAGPPD